MVLINKVLGAVNHVPVVSGGRGRLLCACVACCAGLCAPQSSPPDIFTSTHDAWATRFLRPMSCLTLSLRPLPPSSKLPKLLELVGLAYTGWFIQKYALYKVGAERGRVQTREPLGAA